MTADATDGDLRRAQSFAGHNDPRITMRYDRDRENLDKHGAPTSWPAGTPASPEPQTAEQAADGAEPATGRTR